jgi:hypothetical protein
VELDFQDSWKMLEWRFKAGITAHLVSHPGHGKTSLIRQYADAQGPDYGLFELNGALANVPDFGGWFYRVTEVWTDFDGSDRTIEAGRYTFPYMLFDKRSGRPFFQFKNGVFVVEEYDKIELDLKKALGQTILERRIQQTDLPKSFDMATLANYATDRSGGTKELDMIIGRRGESHMRNSADNFIVFGQDRGLLQATMAFASMEQHGVFTSEAPKDQGPWLNPRSLELADKQMQAIIDSKADIARDPLVRTAQAGIIGEGSAGQYLAFYLLGDKIPTINEIVKDPAGCRLPTAMDQMIFTIFNMAEKADKKNVPALVRYMSRMKTDMGVIFYRNALIRDKSLMQCREFGDWAVANKEIIALVNSTRR